jgi:ribonuclease HII
MPDFQIEDGLVQPVAGVDEVGRGPWAGPVVAGAVILERSNVPRGIADSKQLSRAAREALDAEIRATSHVGIGIASVAEIDELNILAAALLAMSRAVTALSLKPAHVLVDGRHAPKLSLPCTAIVGGDRRSMAIAAGSIVAKVYRDRLMCDLSAAHPGFGWERNAGYGTREHRDALARIGVTPHHRRSFKPVAARIDAEATYDGTPN